MLVPLQKALRGVRLCRCSRRSTCPPLPVPPRCTCCPLAPARAARDHHADAADALAAAPRDEGNEKPPCRRRKCRVQVQEGTQAAGRPRGALPAEQRSGAAGRGHAAVQGSRAGSAVWTRSRPLAWAPPSDRQADPRGREEGEERVGPRGPSWRPNATSPANELATKYEDRPAPWRRVGGVEQRCRAKHGARRSPAEPRLGVELPHLPDLQRSVTAADCTRCTRCTRAPVCARAPCLCVCPCVSVRWDEKRREATETRHSANATGVVVLCVQNT